MIIPQTTVVAVCAVENKYRVLFYSLVLEMLYSQLVWLQVMAHSEDISSTAASLARLDVATSLGLLAQERVRNTVESL